MSLTQHYPKCHVTNNRALPPLLTESIRLVGGYPRRIDMKAEWRMTNSKGSWFRPCQSTSVWTAVVRFVWFVWCTGGGRGIRWGTRCAACGKRRAKVSAEFSQGPGQRECLHRSGEFMNWFEFHVCLFLCAYTWSVCENTVGCMHRIHVMCEKFERWNEYKKQFKARTDSRALIDL